MKLAFRKPSDALGRIIAAHDVPRRFCHVELVLTEPADGAATCFSAHLDSGTRFTTIHGLHDSAEWELLDLPALDDTAVFEWCRAHAGRKYDLEGVKAFKLPWHSEDPGRWFCSEVVLSALQYAGLLTWLDASRVSPNLLYLLARAAWSGWKPNP